MLEKLIALFRLGGVSKERKLIKERQMKILFNPFNQKWMWVRLNPRIRTWEWLHEATPEEVEIWQGEVIQEWKGLHIQSYENRTLKEEDNG